LPDRGRRPLASVPRRHRALSRVTRAEPARSPQDQLRIAAMTVPSGRSFPLGATVVEGGVNFCVFSRKASAVELLLFDGVRDAEPARVIRLDAPRYRTCHYWHAFVPGLRARQVYAYRAVGPVDPPRGLRFDPDKVLL